MADIKINGLAELQKFLDQLPAKMEANVMRGALMSGLKVIEKEAKARAPVGVPSKVNQKRFNVYPGALRDSIRRSGRIDRRDGKVIARLVAGPKTDAKGRKKPGTPDTFYARFVEFGTRPHLLKVRDEEKNINYRLSRKRGEIVRESMTTINRRSLKIGNNFVGPVVQHPGIAPRPFMRPALDGQGKNAIVAAGEYIKKRLAKKHGLDTADIAIEAEE